MTENLNHESFVARIWLENGPKGEPIWRGHVRQVRGGKEAYFQNLVEMSKFLEQVREAVCKDKQERCGGCRGDLRSVGAANDAFCVDKERSLPESGDSGNLKRSLTVG